MASERPNLRALTVLVKTTPPPALETKYRQLAVRYKPLGPLFAASAEEAFGSGFVMVRREAGAAQPPRKFVVTNRHVVGLASRVRVVLGTDAAPMPADVVYVDDVYDLAVLQVTAEAEAAPEWAKLSAGLAIATAPARDQDVVVASGYPGIGDRPSYQVTRGFVSNERFLLSEAETEQLYLQHTAPIDPGSSGGPLTTPEGRLLGVNTLKIRGRENVGLAVPAAVVQAALGEVARRAQEPAVPPEEQARAACDALLAKLSAGPAALLAVERALGAGLVAEHGLSSLFSLPSQGGEWPGRFLEDPTAVFLRAIALRLQQASSKTAGDAPRCSPEKPGAGAMTFKARLGDAERVLSFASEQGRWKLVSGSLGRPRGQSFLDQLESRQTPKKWKPSLK